MTLVSSFFTNVNQHRETEEYFIKGISILKSNIPKIIFTDKTMYEKIKEFENEYTKIILKNKEEFYFYNYKNLKLDLNTKTPLKDTLEYMFIMCIKTEIIRQAIEFNYFNTEQFIWVDFGIKHVFKCSDEEFIKKIEELKHKKYEKVRIASIWDLSYLIQIDIFRNIVWYFAGGVFGGNKEFLLDFADKIKEKCIQIMEEKQTIMWEVNVWYLVYLENVDMFDPYQSDHNQTLLDNY